MIRTCVCAAAAFFLLGGSLTAAEYRGKLRKVDHDHSTLTLVVNESERTFRVDFNTAFVDDLEVKIQSGLESNLLREATPVTIVTQGKGPDEVAARVRVGK